MSRMVSGRHRTASCVSTGGHTISSSHDAKDAACKRTSLPEYMSAGAFRVLRLRPVV